MVQKSVVGTNQSQEDGLMELLKSQGADTQKRELGAYFQKNPKKAYGFLDRVLNDPTIEDRTKVRAMNIFVKKVPNAGKILASSLVERYKEKTAANPQEAARRLKDADGKYNKILILHMSGIIHSQDSIAALKELWKSEYDFYLGGVVRNTFSLRTEVSQMNGVNTMSIIFIGSYPKEVEGPEKFASSLNNMLQDNAEDPFVRTYAALVLEKMGYPTSVRVLKDLAASSPGSIFQTVVDSMTK
ncbi:MAG: HEAT repeat domain-containing protein [Candidatus Micrarchaeota archaeon]